MATEEDKYKIDGLEKAKQQWKELAAETLGYSDLLDGKTVPSVFGAQVAMNVLSEAWHAAVEFIKGGIEGLVEEDRAFAKLSNALRTMGYDSEVLGRGFAEQAGELEKLTGVDQSATYGIQQLLVQYGIAPKSIKGTTQAILDYAAATGKDAQGATIQLLNSVERGKEELSRMGITIKGTGDATKDLEAAARELEKRFGGSAAAATDSLAGRMDQLHRASDDLAKGFAAFFVESNVGQKVIKALTEAMDGMTYALSEEYAQEARAVERTEQLTKVREQLAKLEARLAVERQRIAEGSWLASKGTVAVLVQERNAILQKAYALEAEKIEAQHAMEAEGEKNRKASEERSKEAEALEKARQLANAKEALDKRHKEEAERYGEEMKEYNRKWLKEYEQHLLNQNEVLDLSIDREVRELGRAADLRKRVRESEEKKSVEAGMKRLEAERKTAEALRRIREEELASAKQVSDQLYNDAKSYAEKVVSLGFDMLREYLTTNQAYTAQYLDLSAQRRQSDEADRGITITLAEAQQQLADESRAALQQRVADALASLAQEAGVKAIFMGAEALAMLAVGNVPGAAAAGAAAAAYAAVAGVGGAAAFALTQNRGLTTAEHDTLASMRAKQDSSLKSGNQGGLGDASAGGRAGEQGAVINVYQFGIAGVTEAQQAGFLRDLQAKYGAATMGAGR